MIYYDIANFHVIVKYKYVTKMNIIDEIAYIMQSSNLRTTDLNNTVPSSRLLTDKN